MNKKIGHVFDAQLQKAYNYINAFMNKTNTKDPHKAYGVIRAVLHTLRDCLTIEEIAHLGAQLPTIIRGVFYEGWRPNDIPKKIKNPENFFYSVYVEASNLIAIEEAEEMTYTTLYILDEHISEGQIRKLKSILPKHLKTMLEKVEINNN